MLSRKWLLTPLVVLSLVAPAFAQEGGDDESSEEGRTAAIGEPAPALRVRDNTDRGKSDDIIAQNRRYVILLVFLRTNDPVSQELLPAIVKMGDELSSKGLKLIIATDEKKDKAEPYLKSKNYTGAFLSEVFLPEPYNVPAVPRAYLIDPAGILVTHFHAGDRLEERVRDQLRKTPAPAADPSALESRLAKAGEALQASQVGRAYTLVRDVELFAAKGSPLADSAVKMRERIEAAARAKLSEARTMAGEKKTDDAIPIITELSVRFAGSKVAEEADTEISRLSADRALKAKIRAGIDNARGDVMLDQAAEHEAAGRYVESIRVLRDVVNRFPDSAIAKKAEGEVDRITNDPRAQKEIASHRSEEEAGRWFDIAERFGKVGMYGKAREYFELVREKHPDSRAAAEAAKRLKNLPEPEPDERAEEADSEEAEAAAEKS